MDHEFYKEWARHVRELADKADLLSGSVCWIWPATMMLSEAITSHNDHGAFLFAERPSQGISVTNTIQSRLPAYGAAPVAKRLAEARMRLRGHFARLPPS